jgi:hypothetical protein
MEGKTPLLWLSFVLLWWLAHALGFLLHDCAHSLTAWALGYKANPLAGQYGHESFLDFAVQWDVNENVDYVPMFAAGKGYLAALIVVLKVPAS